MKVTPIGLAAGAALLAVAGLLVPTVVIGLMMSAPARAVIGVAPADLHAEEVTIASNSGATLRGWYVAGRPGAGAVILMHGVRANRLSMVRRARLFGEAGFSVLLFDFQAHGESTGTRITFGRLESADAKAAVAFVRNLTPTERIGVIGTSLGGAAAILGTDPLRIDALVLESVYPDIGSAIANRISTVLGQTLGAIVERPLSGVFEFVLTPVLGLSPADLRPIDHMANIAALRPAR